MRPAPATPRPADWPLRLAAAIEAARNKPFAWGTHDCAMMAADVILATTGRDPAADWRATYADEAGAEAVIAPHGNLGGLLEHVMVDFGGRECPPAFAQRGDLALVQVGNEMMGGIVLDDRIAVPGLTGIGFVPRRLALRTWAV